MIFTRAWAMPNAETFSIRPIADLLKRYIVEGMVVVDPFARNSRFGTLTNDGDVTTTALQHLDSIEFLDGLISQGVKADVVLFDPPYSSRQVADHYRRVGRQVIQETTQNSRYCRENKTRLDTLLKRGGLAICCGWNTNGMGPGRRDYELIEVLTVCHGEGRNDTLVTVERKIARQYRLDEQQPAAPAAPSPRQTPDPASSAAPRLSGNRQS